MKKLNNMMISEARVRPNTIKFKSKLTILVLSMGLLGMTSTVTMAAPTMKDQLETLQKQLVQQQKMMQEQQKMMQEMQRQLNTQKLAKDEIEHKVQIIEKEADDAELKAQQADFSAQQTRHDMQAIALDVSKETYRIDKSQGTNIKIPDSDTVLTVSGFIRGSAIHDFNEIESPTKFAARHIVTDSSSSTAPDNQTTLTANASRFVLGTATPTEIGRMTTLLSWDFDGNTTSSDADFRMRQAWGQLDDFVLGGDLRIGQVWSSWDDLGSLPETMDFQGPNGSQQQRKPLIRWARDIDKDYTVWLSLEDPDYNVTDGGTQSALPDAIAALKWHGDWGYIRPAIIGRQIRGNADNGGGDTVAGWGTQLAGNIKVPLFHEKDNFKFQTVYGSGIGSYNNDGGFDDAMFNANSNLKAIDSFQGFGAYQHWWTNKVRSNAVFGWVNVNNLGQQSGDSIDRTLYTAANIVWSPSNKVDMGFEYLWGERRNKNNKSGTANRIQAVTKFKF